MRRSFLVLVAVFVTATAASGVSLSVTANKSTYLIGETITLTVTGDDSGVTAYGIFGRLLYNGALVDNGTRSQTQLVGQYGKWTTNVLLQGDTNANSATSAFSYSFSQFNAVYAQSATNLPGTLSNATLIAKALGVVTVSWDTTNENTALQLRFFGLTNAPGTSFTIVGEVPEPVTGALLGFGLLCLALRESRRNSG